MKGEKQMLIRILSTRIIVAALTFLIGISAATAWLFSRAPEQELRVSIPDERWVHIWFESTSMDTKSINEITSEAGLPNLRTTVLPGDDLEVRVWVDASEYGRAFILRRSAGQWSAIRLRGMLRGQQLQKHEVCAAPRSGWGGAWVRLVDAGILTLPDAAGIQCRAGVLDGVGYVVEVSTDKTYRTYMYDTPLYAKCDEAKQMIKIADIIEEEFGWDGADTQ
jgi:hypothetical protein